jgi:hypothetical protein
MENFLTGNSDLKFHSSFMKMLDVLFQAYASEHLQIEPTEDPRVVFIDKDPEMNSITAIFFAEESHVSQDMLLVFEVYYIRKPSIESLSEFVTSILPYIRELDEEERELVFRKETVVDGVFWFYRYNNLIIITKHDKYLSKVRRPDSDLNWGTEPVSSDSFKLENLCSAEGLTQSVFFAVKSVVLL